MPEFSNPGGHFDVIGFALFAAAAFALSLAFELILRPDALLFSVLIGTCGGAALYLYWRHALNSTEPLYALDLFSVRTFRIGLIGNLFSRLGISALPFLLPLLLQIAFGYSASTARWMLAPLALAAIAAKPAIKPLMARFGYRRILVANTRIIGVLIACLALPDASTPAVAVPAFAAGPWRHQLIAVFRHEHPDHRRFAPPSGQQRQQSDGR